MLMNLQAILANHLVVVGKWVIIPVGMFLAITLAVIFNTFLDQEVGLVYGFLVVQEIQCVHHFSNVKKREK